MISQVSFLNVRFNRLSFEAAVQDLLPRIMGRRISRIYYANAHTMVTAEKCPALTTALNRCDLLLADGSGVLWGSRLLGNPLTYNLNGTDLTPALCKLGASEGLSVYFLGAKPGIAEFAASKLAESYPGLKIAGVQDGYFKDSETDIVLEKIRKARPHLLLVAMGVPRQEIWIDLHANRLPDIACMGVGGLFDFMAEQVPRAPLAVRQCGFEWAWRLLMEPRRLWRRYTIGNLVFCGLILRHVFSEYKMFAARESTIR